MTLQDSISRILNDAVEAGAIAGANYGVVDHTGRVLAAESAGNRVVGGDEKMDFDTMFPIFSMTKLITTIAALQLVEKGKLSLDTPVDTVLPELSEVQILNDDGTFRRPTNKITLRMLLSHTAGFAYTFNEKIAKYYGVKQPFIKECSGKREDVLDMVLIFEPGTGWEYGTGIDWAGEAVARVSGVSLGEYLDTNIFKPLGITDMSFALTPEQRRAKLAGMNTRLPDGSLVAGDYSHLPYIAGAEYEAGGAGLFASATSYLKILAAVVNNGVAQNGTRILEAETVRSMFRDQADLVPEWKETIRNYKGLDINTLFPGVQGIGRGWGLSFQMNLSPLPSGRSAGSGTWTGGANLYFTVDPVKGIATTFFSQTLPAFDPVVCKVIAECETTVYASL